jgi:hypothetical protein
MKSSPKGAMALIQVAFPAVAAFISDLTLRAFDAKTLFIRQREFGLTNPWNTPL